MSILYIIHGIGYSPSVGNLFLCGINLVQYHEGKSYINLKDQLTENHMYV